MLENPHYTKTSWKYNKINIFCSNLKYMHPPVVKLDDAN